MSERVPSCQGKLSESEALLSGRGAVRKSTPPNTQLFPSKELALNAGMKYSKNSQFSGDISPGQHVSFQMDDSLLGPFEATGIIAAHIYSDLWRILPDPHPRLSGGLVQVHLCNITPKNSQNPGVY